MAIPVPRQSRGSRPSSRPARPFLRRSLSLSLDGIKEIPLTNLRGCKRILLEFSSSRKIDNSRAALVRKSARIRVAIYYDINSERVICAVYEWGRDIRQGSIMWRYIRREIRKSAVLLSCSPFMFFSRSCPALFLVTQRYSLRRYLSLGGLTE